MEVEVDSETLRGLPKKHERQSHFWDQLQGASGPGDLLSTPRPSAQKAAISHPDPDPDHQDLLSFNEGFGEVTEILVRKFNRF